MDSVDLIWCGKYLTNTHFVPQLLSQKSLPEFSTLDHHHQRFQYFDNLFSIKKPFHNVPVVRKAVDVSINLRVKGNNYYKERKFSEALRAYNLAVCFSTSESVEYYQAVANRSAISFERGRYDLCKSDVMAVINSTLDSKEVIQLKAKLESRLERCLKEPQPNSKPDASQSKLRDVLQYFQLKNPSLSIPSAENFVDVKISEEKGRRIVTTKFVPAGTVLVVEDPFAKVLLDEFRWSVDHCHSCLKPISNGIPCDACVFAIFCSESCRESHDIYMCQVSSQLHALHPSRTLLLATKIITQQGPRKLFDLFLNPPAADGKNVESPLGFTNGKYSSDSYHTILNLIFHDASASELFQYTLDAYAVTEALWEFSTFFQHHLDVDFKIFICSLIVLHLRNLPPNAHSINKLASYDLTEYGAGAYAVLSLINHSCEPNVTRFNLSNGRVAVVTIKSIDNSEVLDNYGAHYAVMPLSERQKHLNKHYYFNCDCEACLFDWPLFAELQERCSQMFLSSRNEQFNFSSENICSKFESLFQKVMDDEEIETEELIKCLQFFEANFKLPFAKFNEAQETFKHYINAAIQKCVIHDY